MNWRSCTEEGYIRKDVHAPERIPVSLTAAARFGQAAHKTMAIDEYEMATLAAYNSVFHSARALLFSQGYIEHSHACVVIALRHLFREDAQVLSLLSTLDKMRVSRHNVQYGGTRVTREEAEFACRFATEFLENVKQRIAP